ncbi:MAG: PAS domain-containing protein [Hyphomicrobiales bacterium]|nr:PAS domain-containing protein [Hyphomicrobiales bacterium]
MSDADKAASRRPDISNEAEETLRAIREGEVDALVIRRSTTEEVFSLQGWDDSYRAFMETMDHGAAALGAHAEVLYANDVFCRFLGKPLSEFQGGSLLDNLPATARQTMAGLLKIARTEKQTAQISLKHEGEEQFFLASAAPFDTGIVSGFALTLTDLTDRVRAEKSSASERAASAIIASANEAVVVCDKDGRITHVNVAISAIQEGDLVGKLFQDAVKLTFPPSSSIASSDDLISTVVGGSALQGIEARAPEAPHVQDVLISAAPLTHEGEAISGCVITMVDFSERKIAERQQLLLMGELDHRVKNTLALVLSISSRTLSNEDTLEGFQKSFSGRIQALAATHNLLAKKAWADLTVGDIVSTELAPFISLDNNRVQLEQLDMGITPRAAIALGLTIHELTTNAVKYGALSAENGKLRLSVEPGPEFLRLDWVESGGPQVKEPHRKGFGRTVIGKSLQYSSKGGADLDFHPDGVRCSIRIPIEDVVEPLKHR